MKKFLFYICTLTIIYLLSLLYICKYHQQKCKEYPSLIILTDAQQIVFQTWHQDYVINIFNSFISLNGDLTFSLCFYQCAVPLLDLGLYWCVEIVEDAVISSHAIASCTIYVPCVVLIPHSCFIGIKELLLIFSEKLAQWFSLNLQCFSICLNFLQFWHFIFPRYQQSFSGWFVLSQMPHGGKPFFSCDFLSS